MQNSNKRWDDDIITVMTAYYQNNINCNKSIVNNKPAQKMVYPDKHRKSSKVF